MDFQENFAKIIEKKTQEIKLNAEKYEGLIKIEVKKAIEIQNKIQKTTNEVEIEQYELEINEIKKMIKQLNIEKREVIGSKMNIGFSDDLNIRSEDLI